jgi:uncharacterized tellurite resistance protein B-like protein
MFTQLKTVIKKLTQAGSVSTTVSEGELRIAAVMLLVEVMMADHHIAEGEKQQLLESTMSLLDISREESAQLIDNAVKQHDELVSLFDLTRAINLSFDQARKLELLTHMWRVAYSDRQWDKYEEHLIRRVADLLYISHQDFVYARVRVQEQLSGSQ